MTTVSVTLFTTNSNNNNNEVKTIATTASGEQDKDKRDEGAELAEQQKDKRCGDNPASDKRLDGWIVLHLGPSRAEPSRVDPGRYRDRNGGRDGEGQAGAGSKQINQPKNATIAHKLYSNFFRSKRYINTGKIHTHTHSTCSFPLFTIWSALCLSSPYPSLPSSASPFCFKFMQICAPI